MKIKTCHKAAVLLLCLAALAVAGCSYGLRPEPAIKTLKVGSLDNRTREPGLSDMLRVSLLRELASRGVTVDEASENLLTVRIERLDVKPLAERGGSAVKFSVSTRAKALLIMPGSEEAEIHTPRSYIIAFGSDVPLDSLYAMRDEAVRRAVEDIASDIASGVALKR